jgi:uncharacterized membrane protein
VSQAQTTAPDQRVRTARARRSIAVVLGLAHVVVAGILVPLTDSGPLGRAAGIVAGSLLVGALASVVLFAVNRSLARDPERTDLAGAAGLVLVAGVVVPLLALGLMLVLARPLEPVHASLALSTVLLSALLVLTAHATRRATRA